MAGAGSATLSVLDDGCVEFEGQLICAGPFPYFKLVAFVAIVGFGGAVEGLATLCLRRRARRMDRRGSILSGTSAAPLLGGQ